MSTTMALGTSVFWGHGRYISSSAGRGSCLAIVDWSGRIWTTPVREWLPLLTYNIHQASRLRMYMLRTLSVATAALSQLHWLLASLVLNMT